MAGRLAVDFGTSNTVVAVWDDEQQQGVPLHVPDYGRFLLQQEERISVVPSVIHYAEDNRQWIGAQVLQRNLYHAQHTFRWMKRYIANRSPIKVNVHGQRISHFDAGKDFLSSILLFTREELEIESEEIALTVPVESFEHYEDWLSDVAEKAGMPRFRLIDEPSAAALGYGAHIQPGDVYLIFDFGGGTLDVSVVLIEEQSSSLVGRRCRVLGKAGVELGGMTIDQWMFQEVLHRNGRSDLDEDVRQISNALLVECERAKERLSFYDRADVSAINPYTGAVIGAEISQAEFEALLDRHSALTTIDRTLRRALNDARDRGYQEEDVKSVLMVGGSSQIPAVQRTLKRIFGPERVLLRRPLDAVARGAASFVAGVDFYDHIQHDYAIRFFDRSKDAYDYRTLVERGTPYPTSDPVARLRIKTTHDEQAKLGIDVFEISSRRHTSPEEHQPMELIFDPSGAARVVEVTPDEEEQRTYFWMNENSRTFLVVDPPGPRGEARFAVTFSVDGNKRLIITARDLRTGKLTHQDYPVIKLT